MKKADKIVYKAVGKVLNKLSAKDDTHFTKYKSMGIHKYKQAFAWKLIVEQSLILPIFLQSPIRYGVITHMNIYRVSNKLLEHTYNSLMSQLWNE